MPHDDDNLIDKNELVTIYTVNDAISAEILKNFLNAEGIACQIGAEGQGGFTGISGIEDIEIMVKAIDADRAEALIRSREKEPDDSEE